MKLHEALRLTTEEGAWVAVRRVGRGWGAARQAMRWDRPSKVWAVAFWFSQGPWKIADATLETMPVRLGAPAIDADWEVVEVP